MLVAVINTTTRAVAAGIITEQLPRGSPVLCACYFMSPPLSDWVVEVRFRHGSCLPPEPGCVLHHAGCREETQSLERSEDGGLEWFRTADSDPALWS